MTCHLEMLWKSLPKRVRVHFLAISHLEPPIVGFPKPQACRNQKGHVRTSISHVKKYSHKWQQEQCSQIFWEQLRFARNFRAACTQKFSRYAQPLLQNILHTSHDRYFSRMQRACAKKRKQRPVLIYNKNILLCFLHLFSSFNTTQYDGPQFTPSWRINCRIELAWWILSKCPSAAKSNCVIDSLLSLAYRYFCLLFKHLVPLVLSLPCL